MPSAILAELIAEAPCGLLQRVGSVAGATVAARFRAARVMRPRSRSLCTAASARMALSTHMREMAADKPSGDIHIVAMHISTNHRMPHSRWSALGLHLMPHVNLPLARWEFISHKTYPDPHIGFTLFTHQHRVRALWVRSLRGGPGVRGENSFFGS